MRHVEVEGSPEDTNKRPGKKLPMQLLSKSSEDIVSALDDFCSSNSDVFSFSIGDLTNKLTSSNIGPLADQLSWAALALAQGLQALGELHPFLGVFVWAFKSVVNVGATVKENDQKVLLVKGHIHFFVVQLFELRHFKSSEEPGKDGKKLSDRLEAQITRISKDVKACASACEMYSKKCLLSRMAQVNKYEDCLNGFITLFAQHRKDLDTALILHTSLGVDAINKTLGDQSQQLSRLNEKLDTIALFRKLDTAREKEARKFIEEHGGAKACLDDIDLFQQLLEKTGELMPSISGQDKGANIAGTRRRLLKELSEDVDEMFKRNLVLFEKKLEMQSKVLTQAIQAESEHIIHTLLSGAHDRIIDPDLQTIWKDMGWKGSVKARNFVLSLHDYYSEKLNQMKKSPPNSFYGSGSPRSESLKSLPSSPSKPRSDDAWALSYINAAYVQPILEAVDDDGTGFVSVKEANTFAASRPAGWSLPQWIAYWAVGWQASISRDRNQIYGLVRAMHSVLNYILPSNRRSVDEYLAHAAFWRIELLLRSTRSVNPKSLQDPHLVQLSERFTKEERKRLESNLVDVGYELDTPATVSLVTGEGRIERFVFPLLELLLRRHLKVLLVACTHVLDTEEMGVLSHSLTSTLLCVDRRIQTLEAIFKQTNPDVQARLGNFAFGMFQLSYGSVRRVPTQNSFGDWVDEDHNSQRFTDEVLKLGIAEASPSILHYGIQDGFQSTDYFEFEPDRLKRIFHTLQGTWTGHFSRLDGHETVSYILRISILVSSNMRTISGKGEDYKHAFKFKGDVYRGRSGCSFYFVVIDGEAVPRTCEGHLDTRHDIMTLQWNDRHRENNPEDPFYQPFELRRLPPSLLRYRYTPQQFSEDPTRSRWAFACSAALHMAQEKLWSRRFFQQRFYERRWFVELTTRNLIVSMGLTPQKPLSPTEKGELEHLRRDLNPSEARFYQMLAEFRIQKLPTHPNLDCDSCERHITKGRILCIHCAADDLSDNINLCVVCIDKTPSKRTFHHDSHHDMIKVEQALHDIHLARVVQDARALVHRVKGIFRSLENDRNDGFLNRELATSSNQPELTCACCLKPVSAPFWVCLICSRDTFICTSCDRKKYRASAQGTSPRHSVNHTLVRVRDTSAANPNASIEERLHTLQQNFISLERRTINGLAAINAKVEELTKTEQQNAKHLASIEADVEKRFNGLETVLRQISSQIGALSPSSNLPRN